MTPSVGFFSFFLVFISCFVNEVRSFILNLFRTELKKKNKDVYLEYKSILNFAKKNEYGLGKQRRLSWNS